ncbi:hypothetical protein ACFZDP_40615 [Streptomyces mirabilis]|uniref:hypothetical protein n=1 Tax=Streptomyces mirabilis TaxID=68239 RepID=UPI0036ED9921
MPALGTVQEGNSHDRPAPHHTLTEPASNAAIDTACRVLRLPTMRAQFTDTVNRAEREHLSYRGFLAELLMHCGAERPSGHLHRQFGGRGPVQHRRVGPSRWGWGMTNGAGTVFSCRDQGFDIS